MDAYYVEDMNCITGHFNCDACDMWKPIYNIIDHNGEFYALLCKECIQACRLSEKPSNDMVEWNEEGF
jgi:transcription elongation factor Elf1